MSQGVPRRAKARNKAWARPLAEFVGGTLAPVLAKRGLSAATLLTHWPDIVGQRLAATTRPIKVQWPAAADNARASQSGALLHLRVTSDAALEIQHSTDQLLGRINGHLGWRCISRVKLHQGPIDTLVRPTRPVPKASAIEASRRMTAHIADDDLRAALARLGSFILP